MKTFICAIVLLTFIGLLLTGCSDKAQVPVTPSTNDHSATSLMKSSGSGAMIFRYDLDMWWLFFDADAGLMLVLGVNDFSRLCAGEGGVEAFKNMDIYLPNKNPDLARALTKVKGIDVTASVWQTSSLPETFDDFCAFVTGNRELAVGTANFIYTDNDFYAPYQENKNSNAFSYRANGTVSNPNGQVYSLNFVDHVVWDGADFSTIKEHLKIQLTPTGGK